MSKSLDKQGETLGALSAYRLGIVLAWSLHPSFAGPKEGAVGRAAVLLARRMTLGKR